jgi:hypothetical protein
MPFFTPEQAASGPSMVFAIAIILIIYRFLRRRHFLSKFTETNRRRR